MHSDKLEQEIARVVQSVNEWDDRTSPDDYPEHLLITSEELADILRNLAEVAIPMGIEASARFVEKRLHDYVSEHGSTDPDTGTVEYPGNGEEYVYELEEIIEGIRELASPAHAAFLPTEDGEFNGNVHDDASTASGGDHG
ncbi:hypothetical protein [Shinella zoogloeoides]|uniref:hypothetical protein n=1 Tax=Shinella zoogloeoides TaxID=352475 RepID=UPI002740100A|nr:hypothetical protein [Shinella zoogloeoides]WLR92907.1 hypothetical protein Q9316_01480 [Shinella zoogloeoides]